MKPECWQCSRLDKPCVYESTKPLKSRKSPNPTNVPPQPPKIPFPEQNYKSSLSNILNSTEPPKSFDNSLLPDPDFANVKFISDFDTNLLTEDLSNLVSTSFYEEPSPQYKLYEPRSKYFYSIKSYVPQDSSNTSSIDVLTVPGSNTRAMLFPHVPLEAVSITASARPHLEKFYCDFATIVLPFEVFDDRNPARNMLLREAVDHDYLLCAILACGAGSSYISTGLQKDKEACNHYLQECYTHAYRSLCDDKLVYQNIEPILMTVLLLTSFNANSKHQEWRTHLHGAKQLMKEHAFSKPHRSAVLEFCTHWFMCFEILISVNNPFGGTLQQDDELDMFFQFDATQLDLLRKVEVCASDGYSLLLGCHSALIPATRDYIKYRNRMERNIQAKRPKMENVSVFEIYRLIGVFEQHLHYTVISRDGIIPKGHKFGIATYDYGDEPDNCLISKKVKGVAFARNGDTVTLYSWYDIAHQTFTLAFLINLSTKFLELKRDHPLVIELSETVVKLLYFLDYIGVSGYCTVINKENMISSRMWFYCMMLQWPLLTAGCNLTDKVLHRKIEKFFELMEEVGVGSASHTIERLRRVWEGKGEEIKDVLPY